MLNLMEGSKNLFEKTKVVVYNQCLEHRGIFVKKSRICSVFHQLNQPSHTQNCSFGICHAAQIIALNENIGTSFSPIGQGIRVTKTKDRGARTSGCGDPCAKILSSNEYEYRMSHRISYRIDRSPKLIS